jgi:hypothetical protein
VWGSVAVGGGGVRGARAGLIASAEKFVETSDVIDFMSSGSWQYNKVKNGISLYSFYLMLFMWFGVDLYEKIQEISANSMDRQTTIGAKF